MTSKAIEYQHKATVMVKCKHYEDTHFPLSKLGMTSCLCNREVS